MDIYYFEKKKTPHLAALMNELGLVDGLPYTLTKSFQFDFILNKFFHSLVVPQSPSERTWSTYAEQLSLFFRFLESRGKTWIDAHDEDLKVYYRLRRISTDGPLKKISTRSWNVFVAAVRRLYEWAYRHGHIQTIPFNYKEVTSGSAGFSYGQSGPGTELSEKIREKDIRYMTEEDFNARFLPIVTNTRQGMRNALFVRLLMRSGLRADEAVTLKVDMLPDPDNPTYAGRKTCPLTIIGKGGKERIVRVPKSWLRDAQRYIEWDRADAIENWKAKNPQKSAAHEGDRGFLFLTSTGTPVQYNSMYKMMRKAGDKAGFNFNAHPHMLRHSYAVYQLSAMIRQLLESQRDRSASTAEGYRRMVQDPLRKLQKLMGHSDVNTTMIYLDYLEEAEDMIDVTDDAEGFAPEDGYEDIREADV